MKQTKILTHATHVNGWFPAVYMSCMSQNFRLFHVSNLSVRNFRIFLLMYTGFMSELADGAGRLFAVECRRTTSNDNRAPTGVLLIRNVPGPGDLCSRMAGTSDDEMSSLPMQLGSAQAGSGWVLGWGVYYWARRGEQALC